MNHHVYRSTERRSRVAITPELERAVLALLAKLSQQQAARRLGLAQSTVWRIARRYRDGGADVRADWLAFVKQSFDDLGEA